MNSIIEFIREGGIVMYPLLLMSIVAVAIVVERLIAYRDIGNTAPSLFPTVNRLVRDGRYDEAIKQCETTPGPVAACMATILRHRHQPAHHVEGLVNETGNDYFLRLERFLPVLDTFTTLAPLLGLLGTIIGMIAVFKGFLGAQAQGGQGSTAVLGGVAEALYATATGIAVALFCFVFYNYFTARVRTVQGETEQAATRMMNVVSEIGSGAGSARATGTGTGVTAPAAAATTHPTAPAAAATTTK